MRCLLFIVLFAFACNSDAQNGYQKNKHVEFNHSIKGLDHVIKYTFKDKNDNFVTFECTFNGVDSKKLVSKFGIPKSFFRSYRIKEDGPTIADGLFMIDGKYLRADKNAIIAYYSETYCKPIAMAAKQFMAQKKIHQKKDIIEFMMTFFQDIPYGVPVWDNDTKDYSGILVPPELLINGFGDCDSKAIFFIGVMHYLIKEDMAFIDFPTHLTAGIKLQDTAGSKFEGYLVSEITGPKRNKLGYSYHSAKPQIIKFTPHKYKFADNMSNMTCRFKEQ